MTSPTLARGTWLVLCGLLAACGQVDIPSDDGDVPTDHGALHDGSAADTTATDDSTPADTATSDADTVDAHADDAAMDAATMRDDAASDARSDSAVQAEGGHDAATHDAAHDGATADAGSPDFTRAFYQGSRASGFASYQSWFGPRALVIVGDYVGRSSWSEFESTSWIIGTSGWRPWIQADPSHRMINVAVPVWPSIAGSLAACARGDYDSHYRTLGANFTAAGMGHSVFRFGWEEGGNWFDWTVQRQDASGHWAFDTQRKSDFRACFARFSRAVHSTDPQAVIAWDGVSPTSELDAVYPGDDVVDHVSYDVYDRSYAAGTYPFPSGCDQACMTSRQALVWSAQIGPRLVEVANFATTHHKPFDLGEWGLGLDSNTAVPGGTPHNDHGGMDDPDFVQHIHDLMLGRLPGMLPGFVGGYASYFEALADGGTSDTRLHGTSTQPTMFPRAAALYQRLFGQ